MTEMPLPENRWQTIRDIWKDNRWLYGVTGVFIGLLIYPAFDFIVTDLSTLFQNFVPEAVGIGFTVLFIDRLNQRREEERRIKDLQEHLVREAGSPSYDIAITAVDTIRKRGWLGRNNREADIEERIFLLKGQDLSHADLHKANLQYANLEETNLTKAKLTEANLSEANLRKANLEDAQLQKANFVQARLEYVNLINSQLQQSDLEGANLEGANLENAKLNEANLKFAKLRGCNLFKANLSKAELTYADLKGAILLRADLRGTVMLTDNTIGIIFGGKNQILKDVLIDEFTQFDERTILPDGSNWSPDRDLAVEFGAETRKLANPIPAYVSMRTDDLFMFEFADGVTRRWQRGTGWLDDRDGNPLP